MLSEFSECVELPSGITVSSEHFKLERPGKPELRAEIDFLNGMLKIWIGSASMHQFSNLQIAYPGSNFNSAVGKIIIGEDSPQSSNQIMTKRLSQKFGLPILLSFNYPISEFEEDTERLEIFKWIAMIIEDKLDKNLLIKLSIYIKENVLSEAALKCTLDIIEFNEGHYAAWSFRRRILFSLKSPLSEELEFIKAFTTETPKNYQLWQHRQIIVEKIASYEVAAKDLEDTKVQLSLDAKNIHCWQYRQWLIRHFKLPIEPELEYTEVLLKEDVYNNSAWNHRYFLINSSKEYGSLIKEFENILSFVNGYDADDNESFWNYLAAIVRACPDLSLDEVLSKLSNRFGSPQLSQNYLYLRFLSRFDYENLDKSEICEKLKGLHPINRAFWTSLVQK